MDKYSSAELLLPHSTSHHARSTKRSLALVISLFALLSLLSLLAPSPLSLITSTIFPSAQHSSEVASLRSSCSQAEPIMPSNEVHNVSSVWGFKDRIIEWHQGLIRIPTEVYDEMGEPGEDHRWDIFGQLHECKWT